MKLQRSLFLILVISLCFNVYLLREKFLDDKEFDDYQRMFIIKKIDHTAGFKTFKEKLQSDISHAYSQKRPNLIYFWDSLTFDRCKKGMKDLDSLATITGKHSFNYIFATEMEEEAAKEFLKRNAVVFKNYSVMGDADDFISGVYTEKPALYDMVVLNGKKINPAQKANTSKIKGYYLLMDKNGTISYHNHKFTQPSTDSAFMDKLRQFPAVEEIEQ